MQKSIGIYKKSQKSRTGLIFIASDLIVNSVFPLKNPCTVAISISEKRLIVEALEVRLR